METEKYAVTFMKTNKIIYWVQHLLCNNLFFHTMSSLGIPIVQMKDKYAQKFANYEDIQNFATIRKKLL